LHARGKYVAFLDGDDYWCPHHLAKQMAMFEQDPSLDLAYCDCVLVKSEKPFTRAFISQPQAAIVTFESLLVEDSAISTSSAVVSRQAILDVGLFDESFLRCEDFDLWLRLSFDGARMAYHPDAEVCHRVHPAGLSADQCAMKKDLIRVYEKVATAWAVSREQRQIIHGMVARAEAESAIEELKQALEKEEYARAIDAARRASAAQKGWKLKVTIFSLRVAPQLFRFLHLSRMFLLRRGRYSSRVASAESAAEIPQEERERPLVHR
jgi:cellulose synthase/poly-beta-1,6-N-acetylglucosamine synthase-like glycosyltransferase